MQTSTPPPQRVDMDETKWWDFWNTSYRSEDAKDVISTELFSHVAAVIRNEMKPESSRILEVACGSGTLSRLLAYKSYIGLDISPAAISIAVEKAKLAPRREAASLPQYEAADFHDWAAPREFFDLVICVDAIVCFRDQRVVLQKMAQSLRAGGLLVLTAINPVVYSRIRRTASAPIQEGPVSHWLSRRELHSLIDREGLAIEKSYTIMPRGNRGILRVVNSPRLNRALGPSVESKLRTLKERVGLGQYLVVVARKR